MNEQDSLFSVRDRVIVVTGGAGQLGSQFCQTLLARGAKVAVFDSAPQSQRRFRNSDSSLRFAQIDVSDRTSLVKALTGLEKVWGPPSGLINAAAIDSPPNAPPEENGPFESYPVESWDKIMAVNVKGVMLCCQVIGEAMARAGRGSIVNIGSTY